MGAVLVEVQEGLRGQECPRQGVIDMARVMHEPVLIGS